jgi:N-glycosylase/DNA lyase
MRLEDRKGTLYIDFTAEQGAFDRVIEFLDLAHDVGEPADESEVFLCRRYPQCADLLHRVFLYSWGTHLLRQPILETVVGYLFSVQSTVSLVGRRLNTIARQFPSNRRTVAGSDLYLFPSLEELRSLNSSAVSGWHLGYRAQWFRDLIAGLPDEPALQSLAATSSKERQSYFQRFAGIGPKVAACIDLFAYGQDDAFPVDVWVDRGLRHVLGMSSTDIHGVGQCASAVLGPHCGLFGEYLFRYERDHDSGTELPRVSAQVSLPVPHSLDTTG